MFSSRFIKNSLVQSNQKPLGSSWETGHVYMQLTSSCCSCPSEPAAIPCATCFKSSIGFSQYSHGPSLGTVKASACAWGHIVDCSAHLPCPQQADRGVTVAENPPLLVSLCKALWRGMCSVTCSPRELCAGWQITCPGWPALGTSQDCSCVNSFPLAAPRKPCRAFWEERGQV